MIFFLITFIYSYEVCLRPFIYHNFSNCYFYAPGPIEKCPNQGSGKNCSETLVEAWVSSDMFGNYIPGESEELNFCENEMSFLQIKMQIQDEWSFRVHNVEFSNHPANSVDIEIQIGEDYYVCENALLTFCGDGATSNIIFGLFFCFNCSIPSLSIYINGYYKCSYQSINLNNTKEIKFLSSDENIYEISAWDYNFTDTMILQVVYNTNEICFEECTKCESFNITEMCNYTKCESFNITEICNCTKCNETDCPSNLFFCGNYSSIDFNVCNGNGICLENGCNCSSFWKGEECEIFNGKEFETTFYENLKTNKLLFVLLFAGIAASYMILLIFVLIIFALIKKIFFT